MKKLLVFLLLFAHFFAKAQTIIEDDAPDRDSATLPNVPWFGNNDYLETFLDSIGYPRPNTRIVDAGRVRYHVPIKFWVYRSSAGTGGPTLAQLQTYIDNLNRYYNVDNNTLIGFYMKCVVGYINDDSHLDVSGLEALGLLQSNKEAGCINIHIANNLPGDALGVSYRARFFGIDGIFLSQETYTNNAAFNGTIAHEVGHYFELDHTHQFSNRGRCLKEAISRTRTWPTLNLCFSRLKSQVVCEATGDLLRDTPADHDISSNTTCNYVLTGRTDPWGDHYETPPAGSAPPDPRNLMSYNGTRGCRTIFSRLQIAVMLHSIVRGKSSGNESGWKDSRSMYDDYETDNSNLTARTIVKGEMQERNFHQQLSKATSGSTPTWSNCDVDWVRFTPTVSETVALSTYQLPGYTTVNTRLTLFNAALAQLAQNDNISTTNLYSSISYNVVAGQTYFIRVENLSGNITGYYRLSICNTYSDPATYVLNAPTTVCASSPQSAQITNLPAGATVAWKASPDGILSVPPSGNPVSISYVGSGTATLTATVSVCGGPFVINKVIRAGGYSSGDYPVSGSSSGSCGSSVFFSTNQLPGATSYNWFYPGNWSASGQGTYSLGLVVPAGTTTGNYQVGVRVANACDAGGSPGIKNVFITCNRFARVYKLSPNPATNDLVIVPVDEVSATPNAKAASGPNITEVNIYDQQGFQVKQYKFKGQKQAVLNVSSIKTGIYFVEIIAGAHKERHQLSVVQ